MQARLVANDAVDNPGRAAEYSAAMGQSLLLPATVVVIGLAAACFFARPELRQAWSPDTEPTRETARQG